MLPFKLYNTVQDGCILELGGTPGLCDGSDRFQGALSRTYQGGYTGDPYLAKTEERKMTNALGLCVKRKSIS